jgi:hypothetical protein
MCVELCRPEECTPDFVSRDLSVNLLLQALVGTSSFTNNNSSSRAPSTQQPLVVFVERDVSGEMRVLRSGTLPLMGSPVPPISTTSLSRHPMCSAPAVVESGAGSNST